MQEFEKIEKIKSWLGSGSINVFGLPLSGKDTQCKILAEKLGGNVFGGGDIIRNAENMAPENIASYTRDGLLPPSDDFLSFVLPHLKNPLYDGKPLLLSSLGRWHGEEEAVINSLKESGHTLAAVVYLNIPKDESHARRLAKSINSDRLGRHDDTEQKLNMRFDEFNEKTLSVIDFYQNKGVLVEIDGVGTREQVTTKIIDSLYKFANN